MNHIIHRLLHTALFIATSAVLFIASSLTAHAQGPDGTEPGFSGRLQGGAFFVQTDSQLSTGGASRRTDGLDGPADTHEVISGLASLYLRYQFAGGTAVYAGNPLEIGEGFALATGVSRPMETGTLDVAVTWLPIQEVWKNPYQTGSARDKTDVDAFGLRVQFQEIAGTPWEATYNISRIDIEDDEIGDLEDDLKRTGWTHEAGIKYTLPLKQDLTLSPELSCIYGDIEGRSNSYGGIKLGVQVQRVRPPWVLIGLVSGFHHRYYKTHPLFDSTRQESGVTTFAQVMRLNLFEIERLFASVGAGYIRSDANIDFFDSQTLIGLASVGINF
jgi:hypothetical protein